MTNKKMYIQCNKDITAETVRLINNNGESLGIFKLNDALALAQEQNLDLIAISTGDHVIVKIGDVDKHRYVLQQKGKIQKKHNKKIIIKKIQFRSKIDVSDFAIKMRHAKKFLDEQFKVIFIIKLRFKELSNPNVGNDLILKIKEACSDYCIEKDTIREGRNITLIMIHKKK